MFSFNAILSVFSHASLWEKKKSGVKAERGEIEEKRVKDAVAGKFG